MQNTTKTSWPPMFLDHGQTIGPGVAAMDDDGQLGLLSERHLIAEDTMLHIARRMIVEIVETNFAPSDDFGMLRQPGQFVQMLLRYFLRLVRMDTHCRVNPIVLFGKGQGRIEFLWTRAGADGQQCSHARGESAVEHGFAVFGELREVDVRV